MRKSLNPGQPEKTGKKRGSDRRPVKWTFLEIIGLALASFLILWPVVSLTVDLIRPQSVAHAADVSVTKTVDKSNPAPGDTVTYTITVTNTSGQNNILNITDTVPPELTVNSATGNPAASTPPVINGNNVQWLSIVAADGAAYTLTIVTQVKGSTAGGTVVSNVAAGEAVFPVTGTGPVNSAPAVFTVAGLTGPQLTASAAANATATAQAGAALTATAVAGAALTATAIAHAAQTATALAAPGATQTAQAIGATATAQRAATLTAGAGSGGGGGGGGGGSAPTPTNTIAGSGTGQLTINPATITAVLRTLTPQPGAGSGGGVINPPAGTTPTVTSVPATIAQPSATSGASGSTSGVVSGAFSSNVGGLPGSQVSLLRRSAGNTDETLKTALIDSRNQYFFTGVPATAPGQVYFVRFSNPDPGSGVLRLFDSNPFSFKGGNYQVPTADLTDVRTGSPGASNTAFQAPLTLSWFQRSSEDRYSVTIFRANGGPALDSGNLAGNTSFTIPNGQLSEGSYFAQVNILNPLGTGVSNRQFSFRLVGGIITQPTATRSAALPAATNTPVPATVAQATTAPAPTATTVAAGQSVVEASPSPSTTAVPGTSSTGSGTLPQSGGELPIAGLLLAGFTLIARRMRLVYQNR